MRIDREVEKIMNEGLLRARELLTKHKHVLDAIATELMRVETMERDEYEKILTLHGIKGRRKIGEEPYVASPATGVVTQKPEANPEITHSEGGSHVKPLSEVTHETVVSEVGKENEAPKTSRKQKK